MDRIVDISSDGLHVSVHRGFLVLERDRDEVGRVALDDIGGLIGNAHGLSWSNAVFTRLSERKVPIVLCKQNHMPVSCLWPMEGHHHQGARLQAQAGASKPLIKQLWAKVVSAKIRMQGHILNVNGHEAGAFDMLARKVRSGDPENVEAQAARRYWPLLMGQDFKRDTGADSANALLNYGYIVLRAVVSRAICASGLHPTLGIHHANRSNAFALADDLMEPFRPLVDQTVVGLLRNGETNVSTRAKSELVALTAFDLPIGGVVSPLSVAVQSFVHSLACSFEAGKANLTLPDLPTSLSLSSLGNLPLTELQEGCDGQA